MPAPKKVDKNSSLLALAEKYYTEGDSFIDEEKYSEALILLEKAEAIYLQLGKSRDPGLADTYISLGICYHYIGDKKKRISILEEAISIRTEVFGEEHEETLCAYISLASIYASISYPEEGLKCLHKIIEQKPNLENTSHYVGYQTYHLLGTFYAQKKDLGRAIPYFQKALDISESWEDGKKRQFEVYNLIGQYYSNRGESQKAIEWYQKSIDSIASLGKEINNEHGLSNSYCYIGKEYRTLKQYDKAIVYFQKATRIRLSLFGGDSTYTAFAYEGLGMTYTNLNDFGQADKYLQKALAIRLKHGGERSPSVSFPYLCLTIFCYQKKEYIDALQYAQKGLYALAPTCNRENIYDHTGLREIRATLGIELLKYKAKSFYEYYLKKNQPKYLQAALKSTKVGMQILEEIRKELRSDHSKAPLLKSQIIIYKIGLKITHTIWEKTAQIEILEEAFGFLEKAKGILLLTSMQEGVAKALAVIPSDLLQKEKQLKAQLNQLDKVLQMKEVSEEDNAAEIRDLQIKYLKCQEDYIELMEQLEADYPAYYQLKYGTQTASVLQIQELLHPKELLIEYGLFEEILFIFVIGKNSVSFKKIAYSEDLKQMIEDFQQSIFLSDQEEFCQIGGDLYKLLLMPIEAACKGKNKLIIIPDGVLQRLPFEALVLPMDTIETEMESFSDFRYLLHSFDIQYHYSATLFGHTHQKRKENKGTSKENFLGLAPIKFDKTASTENGYILKSSNKGREVILKSGGSEEDALQNLAATETEVKMVYELFERQKKEATALFYDMASKENLLQHIEAFKYILLSTHGFSNMEYSTLSGLNLYAQDQTKDSLPDNDKLYLTDVMNLHLNADLVVLSSCESGVGKLEVGEGVMALHRAFL
ncbi:MAG: tetratricopeptide repeat protein, partial [Chitinophagales bacterium]